jgi:glycosyltransferase involved in cell wall biosynthesis
MNKPKVFLTGGDGIGWAIDEDLRLTRKALEGVVDFVDLPESEVVHCVWWEGLMMIPRELLIRKRVICHISGEPFRYLTLPKHRHAMDLVDRWVTRTSQAAGQLAAIGIASDTLPYLVDVDTFRSLPPSDEVVRSLLEEWNLPRDTYLIGSFQRDTEGSDLASPKLVKGPDVLLEILIRLLREDLRFHVVLAGPRRHWLRDRLTRAHIPFTYVGRAVDGDDIELNSLARSTLNGLYNLMDLYVVASRSEGGPHAILEAAASGCKVISTPVGLASDILEDRSIFRFPAEAVSLIREDIRTDCLASSRAAHYETVMANHIPESAKHRMEALYASLETIPKVKPRASRPATPRGAQGKGHAPRTGAERSVTTVSLWHTFFEPPYGGGNQFMLALQKGLLAKGVDVRHNELNEDIDAHVLNSIHFDVDQFLEFSRFHRVNVIHRIDGPIQLIRGYDREKDELCYMLNERFASATVLQSAWTYRRIVELGYRPVSPTIVHNAVDPDIFHSRDRAHFDPRGKIRLISTSWSNNPRKGGPTYKWIEENLDWDRFEYTFVGNASENFSRIQRIDPVPSEELGDLLRQHHIYITASRNDPCSNALIEALACGLPALYFNDGGHPELVGMGGVPFTHDEDILPGLERLAQDYELFQSLIAVPKLEDVATKYHALIEDVIQ